MTITYKKTRRGLKTRNQSGVNKYKKNFQAVRIIYRENQLSTLIPHLFLRQTI